LAKISTHAILLTLGEANQLPTEFRIFVSGWNDTEHGRFLFDAAAARSVMAAYQNWGVDLAIDLEHQMLDTRPQPDPTARDARGSCRLELRPDGSLWAVNVRWTSDGAERLSQKRQRYVSPAFLADPETKRVSKIINVAITAIPATHDTPALVAASVGACMTPDQAKAALDALVNGDAKAALDILRQYIESQIGGGDPDATTEDAPPPVGDGGADENTESAAPPPAAPAAPGADDPKKKDESMMAAARVALALTGKTDAGEAMAELARRSAVAVELEQREARLTADRATLEATERKALVAKLVTLGYETPATAWSDDSAKVPCKRLAGEPLDELRARVGKLAAVGPRTPAVKVTPAIVAGSKSFVVDGGQTVVLDARELAICEQSKCDPQVFATLKSRRTA
jgi:hypothetical protein